MALSLVLTTPRQSRGRAVLVLTTPRQSRGRAVLVLTTPRQSRGRAVLVLTTPRPRVSTTLRQSRRRAVGRGRAVVIRSAVLPRLGEPHNLQGRSPWEGSLRLCWGRSVGRVMTG